MKKEDKLFFGSLFTILAWGSAPYIPLAIYGNLIIYLAYMIWLIVFTLMCFWAARRWKL